MHRIRKQGLLLSIVVLAALATPANAFATHLDSFFNTAGQINAPGTTLPPAVGDSDETNGATLEEGEPTSCVGTGGTVFYDATNWYEFNPHRNGRVTLGVASTSSGFIPVIALFPFFPPNEFGDGICNQASTVTGVAQLVADVTAGSHWKVQIGTDIQGGNGFQGTYDFALSFDSDDDGDGLRNSQDGCDNDPGPGSNGGCPLPAPRPPNRDSDGLNDAQDNCPTLKGAIKDGGCPRATSDVTVRAFYFNAGGAKNVRLRLKRVPAGAKVEVRCKRRGRSVCSRKSKKGGKSGRVTVSLGGRAFSPGTKFEVRVTKASYIGIYLSRTLRTGLRAPIERSACMNRGSTKPAKRGQTCR